MNKKEALANFVAIKNSILNINVGEVFLNENDIPLIDAAIEALGAIGLMTDGTLVITTDMLQKVGRVIVEDGKHNCKMFYQDELL